MKKVLILLIILTLGLLGYDGYVFYNIKNLEAEYEQIQIDYDNLLKEEKNKDDEIAKLINELSELKINNIDTNKEYNIWVNLNKNVQDLLK